MQAANDMPSGHRDEGEGAALCQLGATPNPGAWVAADGSKLKRMRPGPRPMRPAINTRARSGQGSRTLAVAAPARHRPVGRRARRRSSAAAELAQVVACRDRPPRSDHGPTRYFEARLKPESFLYVRSLM